MSSRKFRPLTLTPINFSLTDGTSIPAPPESPPDSPRPATPGAGPLSSHPTPLTDVFPDDAGSSPRAGSEDSARSGPLQPLHLTQTNQTSFTSQTILTEKTHANDAASTMSPSSPPSRRPSTHSRRPSTHSRLPSPPRMRPSHMRHASTPMARSPSPTRRPSSPVRRPSSIRNFFGMRTLSSSDGLKHERPASPATLNSQPPTMTRRKSGSWFGKKKVFSPGYAPEENQKPAPPPAPPANYIASRPPPVAPRSPPVVPIPEPAPIVQPKRKVVPAPELPGLQSFGVSEDSLSFDTDDMFKNIR